MFGMPGPHYGKGPWQQGVNQVEHLGATRSALRAMQETARICNLSLHFRFLSLITRRNSRL